MLRATFPKFFKHNFDFKCYVLVMADRINVTVFRALIQPWLKWVFLSTSLNLGWETLHYPLYKISSVHANGIPFLAILHCTVGDAIISAIVYLVVSILLRGFHWPLTSPRRGVVVYVALSLAYTVFSEWRNTSIIAGWSYAPSMPVFFGIGVSPLLQWIVVPIITLALFSVNVCNGKRR